MGKMILQREPILYAKHKAFAYQNEAFISLRDLEYGAIFHEQGLGKTKIAIDIILYWLEKKIVDTAMIVVKKSLIQNWLLELKEHWYIKPALLNQNKQNNFFVFNGPSRVILTNYEVVQAEEERMMLFLKARDLGIVLDESTKIKNPDSNISKSYFRLSPFFKRRIIMTGTPIANRPYDIWAQIYFLDNGKSLGNNYPEFRKKLDLSNKLSSDPEKQRIFENEVSSIIQSINKFTVRETKGSGVISLPEKVFQNIETDWEPIQYEKYDQVRNEMRIIILQEDLPTEDISENYLKRLLRLIQIASNPRTIDQEYSNEPGKIPYLSNLIRDIVNKSEKAIVWSSFIKNIEYLYKLYAEYNPVRVHGKLDMILRNRSIERFKNEPNTKILFATPGAAKEGLTLTSANHVIFYDRGFSLDDYLQAQDRIHRISQKKTCYIYNLIMKNSIDEWIDILLNAKHLAAQLGQNDISIEYYRSNISYSYGDIIKEILNIERGESHVSRPD